MADDIKVGSRVIVPFGSSELEGIVVRVSKVDTIVRLTVNVEMEGVDEPFITTFRLEQIRAASVA